jgi:hypothetical protein
MSAAQEGCIVGKTMFNAEMESISSSDQKKMEQEKLIRQIDYVCANSEMYQAKFRAASRNAAHIKRVEDLFTPTWKPLALRYFLSARAIPVNCSRLSVMQVSQLFHPRHPIRTTWRRLSGMNWESNRQRLALNSVCSEANQVLKIPSTANASKTPGE